MTAFRSRYGSCLAGVGILALLALLMLVNAAHGGEAYCDACKGEGWDPMAKLDEIGNPDAAKKSEVMPGLSTAQKNRVGIWKQPLTGFNESNTAEEGNSPQENVLENNASESLAKKAEPSKIAEENISIVRSTKAKSMLAPIDEVSSAEVLLDISKNATDHIPGSIAISYTRFLHDGNLKSVEEISQILGEAGISKEDSIVIYGECLTCGKGPAPAMLVYWMMQSLGHKNVRVLDGTVSDWAAAGKAVTKETMIRPATNYTPQVNDEFFATYDLVKNGNGSLQIVDARPLQDFLNTSITNARSMPVSGMIHEGKINDEAKLERIFGTLNKNQPVVVYTYQPTLGSVAWFALKLMDFDAKLYSFENWQYNEAIAGNATA